MTRTVILVLLPLLFVSCGHSQNTANFRLVGGPCEGCEAIFEYGDKALGTIDTLPDFGREGTRLKVSGTIFRNDGKTPAGNVILYIYHTDIHGEYTPREDQEGWGRRHGYNRGWVKTGENGKYTFYTIIPGVYPSRAEPAHIHPILLEPNGKYYWVDSYHFKGDGLLTNEEINPESPRGGSSGLLSLTRSGNMWLGSRDFILGKNVPRYD